VNRFDDREVSRVAQPSTTLRADEAEKTEWHRIDRGTGRPLVLLHGGGSSSESWRPVLDILAEHRRVIAFDLPGFGRSPAPTDFEHSIDWLVSSLAEQLARCRIETPVDLVGNSMGGWIALEAAKRGLASSVVALGPAGLWRRGMPLLLQAHFKAMLLGAAASRGRARSVLRLPLVRRATMALVVGRPSRISSDDFLEAVTTLDRSRAVLEPLLRMSHRTGFRDGHDIDVPVTIAFGARERMLLAGSGQVRDHLPAHTRWLELPGCGHVPMSDDPELVARVVLDGTARGAVAARGPVEVSPMRK